MEKGGAARNLWLEFSRNYFQISEKILKTKTLFNLAKMERSYENFAFEILKFMKLSRNQVHSNPSCGASHPQLIINSHLFRKTNCTALHTAHIIYTYIAEPSRHNLDSTIKVLNLVRYIILVLSSS